MEGKKCWDTVLLIHVLLLMLMHDCTVCQCPASCICRSVDKKANNTYAVTCVNITLIDDDQFPTRISNLTIRDSPELAEKFLNSLLEINVLSVLDLRGNEIDHLPDFVFQNFSVTCIDLSHNLLQHIEKNTFTGLQELTYLNLSFNSIRTINVTTFQYLHTLKVLDLSHNNLQFLKSNHFQSLFFLEELRLNFNELQFSQQIFPSNNSLKYLDVSHNLMQNITEKIFHGLKELRFLDVTYNNIDRVHYKCFHQLYKLTSMNLSGNLVETLPPFLFINQLYLKALLLDSLPNLSYLPKNLFTGLQNLEILRITNTPMSFIHQDLFLSLTSLKILDLRKNKITKFHKEWLRKNSKLESLIVTGNMLTCDCDIEWILKKINSVDYNNGRLHIENKDEINCFNTTSNNAVKILGLTSDQLLCGGIFLQNHTKSVFQRIGSSVMLQCSVTGYPAPLLTWTTPKKKVLTYHNFHDYATRDLIPKSDIGDEELHEEHFWHDTNVYRDDIEDHHDRVRLLDDGTLYIDYVLRPDAGIYHCKAQNPSGNISVVVEFRLDYTRFSEVKIMSLIVGFASAATFFLLNLVYAIITAIARRCIKQKRMETVRTLLESFDHYKTDHVGRLKDNYNSQINKIKDQYHVKVDKIRCNYNNQVDKIRDGCSHRVDQLRENYSAQFGRLKGYSSQQVETLRDTYTSQILKLRGYGSLQLGRLRENYKLQHQHAIKLLEIVNLENCRTAMELECTRTDSILFDLDLDQDIQLHSPPDSISISESDYATASDGSGSRKGSLDSDIANLSSDSQRLNDFMKCLNIDFSEITGDISNMHELQIIGNDRMIVCESGLSNDMSVVCDGQTPTCSNHRNICDSLNSNDNHSYSATNPSNYGYAGVDFSNEATCSTSNQQMHIPSSFSVVECENTDLQESDLDCENMDIHESKISSQLISDKDSLFFKVQ